MIEDTNERIVLLTVHFFQLDGDVFYLLQGLRAEEVGRIVIGLEHRLVFRCDHGRQLLQVTDHQQLYTAEGLVSVAEAPEYGVDGIEQVAAHHRDLVDDQQVERGDDAAFLLAEVELALDAGIGHEGRERQLEEGVDGDTAGIDGCHTCGRHNDRAFLALFYDGLQEGGLSRTCLARKEDAATCVLYEVPCIAQSLVLIVNSDCFHSSFSVKRVYYHDVVFVCRMQRYE